MRAKILLKAVMSYVSLIRLAGGGQTPARAEYPGKSFLFIRKSAFLCLLN